MDLYHSRRWTSRRRETSYQTQWLLSSLVRSGSNKNLSFLNPFLPGQATKVIKPFQFNKFKIYTFLLDQILDSSIPTLKNLKSLHSFTLFRWRLIQGQKRINLFLKLMKNVTKGGFFVLFFLVFFVNMPLQNKFCLTVPLSSIMGTGNYPATGRRHCGEVHDDSDMHNTIMQ